MTLACVAGNKSPLPCMHKAAESWCNYGIPGGPRTACSIMECSRSPVWRVPLRGWKFIPRWASGLMRPRAPCATTRCPASLTCFRHATRRALEAGFDGVQIHGAHGYLIDQFLRDGVNDRSGPYGGPIENRARLLLDVVDAAIEEAGADRVSVRLSPLFGIGDMIDSDPDALVSHIAQQLSQRHLAFLELRHTVQSKTEEQALARLVRRHFAGVLMRNGRFDVASAQAALADGNADAIVFGTPFIANPDLVNRIRLGAPWAAGDTTSYYIGGAEGYTDYPQWQEA